MQRFKVPLIVDLEKQHLIFDIKLMFPVRVQSFDIWLQMSFKIRFSDVSISLDGRLTSCLKGSYSITLVALLSSHPGVPPRPTEQSSLNIRFTRISFNMRWLKTHIIIVSKSIIQYSI